MRHALRPYTTVIICEDGVKTFPFDVNHVLVQQYHHMGEGIDYGEVERFKKILTKIILAVSKQTRRPKTAPSIPSWHNSLLPRWPQQYRASRRQRRKRHPQRRESLTGKGSRRMRNFTAS